MTNGRGKLKALAVTLESQRGKASVAESRLWEALRVAVADHGSGRELAKELGITPQYLSDVAHGRRRISGAVIVKLMAL